MTEIIKVKFECDFCDGCGWYEGGPFLQNHCEKCDGKGYVWIEQEKPIKHKWTVGSWNKETAARHYVRIDKCSLCGCEKTVIKSSKNSNDRFIAHYNRSHQIFSPDHMPECWGAANPQ